MSRRLFAIVLVLFASPLSAFAQGTERYLPSGSQIVLQVDAYAKTKAAYDRTAAGQMMAGDTGKFCKAFYEWLVTSAETAAGEFPQIAKEDVALIKDALGIVEKLNAEGLALGIEFNQAWPTQGRIVVALPKLGAGQPNLAKLLGDLRAKAANVGGPVEIKETKIGGRTVNSVELPIVQLGWWAEGQDFLLTIGTEPVADYIKALDAGKTGVGNNPIYKKVLELGDFPTRSRAYIDVPSLVKLADKHSEEAAKTVDELGLKSAGPILSVSGYDGLAKRTITDSEIIGPRKGLMTFTNNKKVSLADLPPLPSDLTTFNVGTANAGQMYGTILDVGEKVLRIYLPDQADNIKQGIKGFEDIIGVDLKKDLFSTFDDLSIQYSSPSEGIFGNTALFKVKDEARLKKAISNITAAIPQIPGVDSGIKKRKYREAEVYEFRINTPGNITVHSFMVYKGYFAYAPYPQPLHGFVLRMDGVLPTWKADERLTKALAAFPKEFSGLTFSDPRPGVELMLANLPPLVSLANSFTNFVPGITPFDISQIPHAQEATRHLFPNVSISTDDGKRVRIDSRSSVGW